MGTDCRILVVDGDDDLVPRAQALVESYDRRWTRFSRTSELARLNDAAGDPVVLPRDTYDLVAAAVACWSATAGRFDPTVHDAVRAAGYDRSFADATLVPTESAPAPGCAAIELDDNLGSVRLPHGVSLDLGGIGKGFAADLVAGAVRDGGAAGVLVDLGGDVRVAGRAPDGDVWRIAVADPFDEAADISTVVLAEGAVATSSIRRRRWQHDGAELHHLIDPSTGRPAATAIAAVTVVAATTAWAEVTAKAAIVAGVAGAEEVVRAAGATGLAVTIDGAVIAFDGLEAFR